MPVWANPERLGPDWILRSRSGRVIARMPAGSVHFDQVYWPFLDGEEDLSRIEELYPEHMWTGVASPPGPAVSMPEELTEGARVFRARTDRAIVALFGGNLLEMGQFYYRMDNFLAMLAGEPSAPIVSLTLSRDSPAQPGAIPPRRRALHRCDCFRRRSGRAKTARKFHRVCTVSSSSPVMRRCGSAPGNWPTSR